MKTETRQKLFDYFSQEHNISLMDSDFNELENCAAEEHNRVQGLRDMLEDVVNELDLSESIKEEHGQNGTAPAILVRLVLEQKDKEIQMLRLGMKKIGSVAAADVEGWKPYPENKPINNKGYLVTMKLSSETCGEIYVVIKEYYQLNRFIHVDNDVIAFRELPSPYQLKGVGHE